MKRLMRYIQQHLSLRLGLIITLIIAVAFSLLFDILFYHGKQYIQRTDRRLQQTGGRYPGSLSYPYFPDLRMCRRRRRHSFR